MQPLTAEDFSHNSSAFNYLRGIPAIPMKTNILGDGGEGVSRYAAPYNPRMKKDWTTRLIHSDLRAPFTLSFIVFGGATAEAMVPSLTESVQNGAVIPPGSPLSWKPLLLLVRAL